MQRPCVHGRTTLTTGKDLKSLTCAFDGCGCLGPCVSLARFRVFYHRSEDLSCRSRRVCYEHRTENVAS